MKAKAQKKPVVAKKIYVVQYVLHNSTDAPAWIDKMVCPTKEAAIFMLKRSMVRCMDYRVMERRLSDGLYYSEFDCKVVYLEGAQVA